MQKIFLGDLTLVSYDPDNLDHVTFKEQLTSDRQIKKYIRNIKSKIVAIKDIEPKMTFNAPYFVMDQESFIGYVYYFKPEDKEVEMHYAVASDQRGYGYGSKILKESASYILESFKEIEKLSLVIVPSNTHSIATASKAGFEKEGIYYKKGR